jgi:hypothetical protein
MFECFACSSRYKKVQALRGHLRHCEWHTRRRLNAQAEAEAGKQPAGQIPPQSHPSRGLRTSPRARADDDKPLRRRPGRDSQESLRQLLDVYEALPLLKRECLDHVVIVRQLASMCPDLTRTEDWEELYWMLDDCERDHEMMVFRFRLDPVLLFAIYRTMLVIKRRWLSYRASDRTAGGGEETHEESQDHSRAEEEKFTPIVSKLKDMVVASC